MKEIIVLILLGTGVLFCLLGGVGLLRLPDLYMRLSAGSKAATLGSGSLLLAAAVHFGDAAVVGLSVATVFFLAMTTPVASYMIARAAYRKGVALWPGTREDEAFRKAIREEEKETEE